MGVFFETHCTYGEEDCHGTYPEWRSTGYQRELLIAMLLENEGKEDKPKSGWKTSRKTSNYGMYNLKMPKTLQMVKWVRSGGLFESNNPPDLTPGNLSGGQTWYFDPQFV